MNGRRSRHGFALRLATVAAVAMLAAIAGRPAAADDGRAEDGGTNDRPADSAATTAPITTASAADSLLLPASEFTWAGNERYTITGRRPQIQTDLDPLTTALAGSLYAGGMIAMHIYHKQSVWKDGASFHFLEDGDYALYSDKAGHFWSAHFTSYLGSELALDVGFDDNAATWIGAAFGLSVMTWIEVGDGFGRNWGFSPSDMASNTLGAAYFVARHYVPVLERFSPKYSYLEPEWYGQQDRPEAIAFFDNYNGATNWISVDVHSFLPESERDAWPSWLGIAFGYGARNLGQADPGIRYVVALDYDLVRLLPDGGSFWNWLKQTLNSYKLPAPAIEFGPGVTPRFHLLYPFRISVGALRM